MCIVARRLPNITRPASGYPVHITNSRCSEMKWRRRRHSGNRQRGKAMLVSHICLDLLARDTLPTKTVCLTSTDWESAIDYLCGALRTAWNKSTNSTFKFNSLWIILIWSEVRLTLLERSFRRIFLLYFEYISEPPLSYFYLSREVESALLLSVFFKNFSLNICTYTWVKKRVDPAVTRPSFSPQLFPMTTFTKLEEPWPARATPSNVRALHWTALISLIFTDVSPHYEHTVSSFSGELFLCQKGSPSGLRLEVTAVNYGSSLALSPGTPHLSPPSFPAQHAIYITLHIYNMTAT